MTPFEYFKSACTAACHEREACTKGYKQMLASTNMEEMMQTWRDNWDDIVEGKFAEIIRIELPKQYPSLAPDMNRAGIYLNECPEDAKSYVKVIITDVTNPNSDISSEKSLPIHIYGKAQAYILGKAKVIVHDHAQVYNTHQKKAEVTLYDYSHGGIHSGKVIAKGRSTLTCSCDAVLDGAVICTASGGTIKAISYRELQAFADTLVYTNIVDGVTLNDSAQIHPLKTDDKE